jgi:hypothetical protein
MNVLRLVEDCLTTRSPVGHVAHGSASEALVVEPLLLKAMVEEVRGAVSSLR